MPLNEVDKAWIRQAIRDERHGVAAIIRDWGGAGATVTVLILALTTWTGYVEFRTRTNDRLDSIEKTQTAIALKNQATLPQADFEATLADLKTTVKKAKAKNVRVSSDTMNDLQDKLMRAAIRTPDYWPAVSAFISYRSFVTAPQSHFSDLMKPDLPNCVDRLPTIGRVTGIDTQKNSITFTSPHYDNCRFTLDSSHDDQVINAMLGRDIMGVNFKHCLIVYRGGPIELILEFKNYPAVLHSPTTPDLPVTYSGKTLNFEDCLFEFDFTKTPPPPGQEVAHILLAQSNPSGTVQVP
jgi:hypothetical protein